MYVFYISTFGLENKLLLHFIPKNLRPALKNFQMLISQFDKHFLGKKKNTNKSVFTQHDFGKPLQFWVKLH